MRNRLAPSERMSLRWSGSTLRRPSKSVTVIGKKATSATITIFGSSPKPSSNTSGAASTTMGTACEPTTYG